MIFASRPPAVAPRKQLTPRRRFQRVAKPRANGLFQRGVFDKVQLGDWRFEPEVEVGLGVHGQFNDPTRSSSFSSSGRIWA